MRNGQRSLACLALLFSFASGVATAQNYRFEVPSLKLEAHVNPDASVRFVYEITFENMPGAHPIDIVDIGLPHDEAEPEDISASIGGSMVRTIRDSTYVANAKEFHLDGAIIPAGGSGTIRVKFTMPDMVYQDTTRDDYASLQLTPTWFDPNATVGRSHVQIAVYLPAGVKPDEVLHQGVPFTQKAVLDDQVIVAWDFPNTQATGPHNVAVSFPKRDMQRVVEMSRFGLLVKWFEANTRARLIAGLIFAAVFAVMFFRFSGGTGWSVFLFLGAAMVVLFLISPKWQLLSFLPLVVLFRVNEWLLSKRKAKTTYLPAIAEIEGGGIKRGLTAPEAAVILELPLSKVLTLVIFGLLRKKLLKQVEAEPLRVTLSSKVPPPMADWGANRRADHFRDAAKRMGTVVHRYELPFLELIHNNADRVPTADLDFTKPLQELVKFAAGRLKGFDLSDTQAYYRSIVQRAIKEAKTIGDLEVREKVLDSSFDWVLMDDSYPTVFGHGGYMYHPPWLRTSSGSGGGLSLPTSTGGGRARGAPSFGDVTASFAGWTENTFGKMATAFDPARMSFDAPRGGVLDLSGADRVTTDVFEAMAEASASSGGGGGGGGGCACAGCACACACAGGGR